MDQHHAHGGHVAEEADAVFKFHSVFQNGSIYQETSQIQTTASSWSDVPGNPNPYEFTPTAGIPRFFTLRQ